jgi:LacI family transcriptional regulator
LVDQMDRRSEVRRVTVAAIAREAGVSVPTVSRVLNGRRDVAPQTRERIEKLLQKYDYRRRPARPLGTIKLVDLVFNDLDSPWALEIIRGVEDAAHASSAGAVVSAIHGRTDAARQWLGSLRSRRSDGVIFVTSTFDSGLQQEMRRLGIPVVVIDPAGVPTEVPTVGATNWTGGLDATRHLLSLGHTRIGFISGPSQLLCSRARLDGYRAALESAGHQVDPTLVRPGNFYHESGFEGARQLLALPKPPTAVFAASDQMAFGVYEAVRQAGLRIPDDISVVGFDDLPGAQWSSPPLTTIRQPLGEMGALAVRTVLRLVRGETVDSPRVELATELLVRDSSRAIG